MSDTMNLIPTEAFGSNSGWAPAIGAFLGSWFGNGWMGGYGGGWGRGYGYGGDAAGLQAAAAVGSSVERQGLSTDIMNRINTLDANLDGLTRSQLQGECSLQQAISNKAADVIAATTSGYAALTNNLNQNTAGLNATAVAGFADINNAITNNAMRTNNVLTQGFAGLNTAIRDNSYETRLNVKDLQAAMYDNCCGLKSAVMSEGAMTRQLIQNNYIGDLQTKLCDAKAKIATLENQAYTAASNAAQTTAIINALKSSS